MQDHPLVKVEVGTTIQQRLRCVPLRRVLSVHLAGEDQRAAQADGNLRRHGACVRPRAPRGLTLEHFEREKGQPQECKAGDFGPWVGKGEGILAK